MSADAAADPPANSLAGMAITIFSELLQNLTHDLVLQTHRSEKQLRTQQQQHAAQVAAIAAGVSGADVDPSPRMPPGNSLASLPTEFLCPRCHLPRHTLETMAQGLTVTLESGEKKKYCSKLPFQNVRGHDIYGNPFPTVTVSKDKKAKALKEAPATGGTETPGIGDSPAASTPQASGDTPAAPGELPVKTGKPNISGIVYVKCTSCDNEKVASTRFASHLEKCLGLSGRKSSRAAMAKMNNSTNGNGSTGGSPMLTPADLPKPSAGIVGSRKPSPEKKGSPTPSGELLSKPAATSGSVNSTPKKKKKAPAQDPSAAAQPSDSTAPNIAKDPSAGPKKANRKRKAESTLGSGDGPGDDGPATAFTGPPSGTPNSVIILKPKKQKLAPQPGSSQAQPSFEKKSQLSKFKNRAGSPTVKKTAPSGADMERSRSESSLSQTQTHSSHPSSSHASGGQSLPLVGSLSKSKSSSGNGSGLPNKQKPFKPKPLPGPGSGVAKKGVGTGDPPKRLKKKVVKPAGTPGAGAGAGAGAGGGAGGGAPATAAVGMIAGKGISRKGV